MENNTYFMDFRNKPITGSLSQKIQVGRHLMGGPFVKWSEADMALRTANKEAEMVVQRPLFAAIMKNYPKIIPDPK